jgi:1-acyl-sn-glycerol-3-phosphate acyltransferase
MKAVTSALTWAAITLLILLLLPTMLLVRLFDRTPARVYTGRTFRIVGSWVTKLNPAWHVTVEPVDAEAIRHPYVVVSNHQSQADIPALSLLPWEMKWVAKKELFDLPVMGWLMRMAGDIPVDRKDPKSRSTVLGRATRVLRHGTSVMFFPEGTRSRDGRVKTFRDGAFRLAIQAGVPVLPVAIDGTMNALPKHGWQFSRADVRIAVLAPVPTDGLTQADVADLRDRVRRQVVEQVAVWRGVPADSADALASGPSSGLTEAGEDGAKSGPSRARVPGPA